MNTYYVSVTPATLEGEFSGDTPEDAIAAAIDSWCMGLDDACDAVCAGTFTTRLGAIEDAEVPA